jgi:hypothetical protein
MPVLTRLLLAREKSPACSATTKDTKTTKMMLERQTLSLAAGVFLHELRVLRGGFCLVVRKVGSYNQAIHRMTAPPRQLTIRTALEGAVIGDICR